MTVGSDFRENIIIGAGASGLACAISCSSNGKQVSIIDAQDEVARKIGVSGGGKCNFTNKNILNEDYVCANKHFITSALSQYTNDDFIEYVKSKKIKYADQGEGQLFCVHSAQDLVRAMAGDCRGLGVEFILNSPVDGVERTGRGFRVHAGGKAYECAKLVIASGGLAWPQIGATNFGYGIARELGLKVLPLRPGLVPFVAKGEWKKACAALSGISVDVRVKGKMEFTGALLFTHKGISGPVVLNTSVYWQKGDELRIDWLPGMDLEPWLAQSPKMEMKNKLAQALPKKLAFTLCEMNDWTGKLNGMGDKKKRLIAGMLHDYPFLPQDTEGFNKAEVTLGGVDTDHISSKTMEVKSVPGLYFTGEVLDVTGRLGGFNLQWAWSSGYVAGKNL